MLFSCSAHTLRSESALFANQQSGSALFTVTEGRYELDVHDNKPIPLSKDDAVVFAYINGKVAVKTVNSAELFMRFVGSQWNNGQGRIFAQDNRTHFRKAYTMMATCSASLT